MQRSSDANAQFLTFEPFLSSILFRYSALVSVKNLSFPPNTPFNVAHEFFVEEILLNHHLTQYPPSDSYQQSFWKWAIVQLENLTRGNEDVEIDERIYAHYLSLRTGACSGTPPNSFITYYWRIHRDPRDDDSYETITLLESRTTIEAGTTGLRTWKASQVLAQHLIQRPYLVNTSNVLELGSGTGFVGILVAALQLRAATAFVTRLPAIYLTDVDPAVLARCQSNVKLPCNPSSSHSNVQYNSLDWLDSLSSQESLESFFNEAKADIILAADTVFDPALIPPLVKTIFLALSSKLSPVAFVALTVRNEETLSYFLDEIGKVLKTEEVTVTHNVAEGLLLQIPDQVDAELEVKIFKITRERDT